MSKAQLAVLTAIAAIIVFGTIAYGVFRLYAV
jgi:hypothetical protein